MTVTPLVRTVSVEIDRGVFVDVSLQLKSSGVSVPKPRPNPRPIAELRVDIGDPFNEDTAQVEAVLRVDLRYEE